MLPKFSSAEIKQLSLSFLIVSLVFHIAFYIPFKYSLIIVGLGFVLHELAHKFMANWLGLKAEFHYDLRMLIISLLASFMHFVFLAPGYVEVKGRINIRKNGLISLAGPMMNLLLAMIFLIWNSPMSKIGVAINAWLAFFNLLPFPSFDGIKVLFWNKLAYFTSMGLALFFVFAYHI